MHSGVVHVCGSYSGIHFESMFHHKIIFRHQKQVKGKMTNAEVSEEQNVKKFLNDKLRNAQNHDAKNSPK